jgi:hypothetical protein
VQTRSDEGSKHPIDDGGAQPPNPDARSSGGKEGHYFCCLDFFDKPSSNTSVLKHGLKEKLLAADLRGWGSPRVKPCHT